MDIKEVLDHRLTILSTIGLNVEGCDTEEELAQKILEWLKEKRGWKSLGTE
jgi:hypothetical protein